MMGQGKHSTVATLPTGFTPGITVEDPVARFWLGQSTMALRREVAWLWYERGTLRGVDATDAGLPQPIDPLTEALDRMRFDDDRTRFFETDQTAAYLTQRLAMAAPPVKGAPAPGGFGWLVTELALQPVECFALALALGGAVDSARGAVVAACRNLPGSAAPTMALLQRLWHQPDDVLALLDPAHPLIAAGILSLDGADWEATPTVHPLVARQLLYPSANLPATFALVPVTSVVQEGPAIDLAMARLRTRSDHHLTLIPLIGGADAPFGPVAASIASAIDAPVLQPQGPGDLVPIIALAWLRGAALIFSYSRLVPPGTTTLTMPPVALPVPIFLILLEGDPVSALPQRETIPRIRLTPLDHAERLEAWRRALPEMWAGDAGRAALTECARRFRFEGPAIQRVAAEVRALGTSPTREALFAACRDDLDLGDLAQKVEPRFGLGELMLPPRQAGQIRELIRAAGALSVVHHDWGLAKALNEIGLSALFTGPPGTGKTMAAESIAHEVGMPMYRIDLSQVVNKYIGETEKNLRRLFDAADSGDAILFFDEADALFGKRTEVKDAHDRYANLEVSYLLERMERFKGMALLATNRKKDLDEAFLRRLRYVVTFPLPGPEERLRIWQTVLPTGVDCTSLDLPFLAERLPLSGGYIRSAVFNACLQSVDPDEPSTLRMGPLVRAIKDEFDKLGRTVSRDQFGVYASEVPDDR